MRYRLSRALAATLAAHLFIAAPVVRSQTQAGHPQPSRIADRTGFRISSWRDNGIDGHNQMMLARASMTGAPDGMVLFATDLNATDKAIRAVAALGGEIMARFDDVGYFRARLPLKQFAKAEASPGVLIALIEGGALSYTRAEGFVSYPEPKKSKADSLKADSVAKDSTAKDSARIAALPLIPDAAKALAPGYFAFNDMRSYDLKRQHATFDGRGVTVAVLEGGTFDFLNPALQRAVSADGRPIQKLRGVITPYSFDPDFVQPEQMVGGSAYANFDQRRVRRIRTVTAVEGKFTVDDTAYTAPKDGVFSFGRYTRGKKMIGVIWDETQRRAWVDANNDHSFADEKAMAEINDELSIGVLPPLDSTAKEPKRTTSFAVHFDSVPGMMRIYEGSAAHQTMVASVATGAGILGVADASAPGAQVMIVDAGLTAWSFIESWIRAARDPRVDVVTSSQVGEVFVSAGESLEALILNRLVEIYGKPFFASAHNSGPGSTTTGESSTIPRVMSVGGYASAATYKAQYGWNVPDKDYLVAYASRGPASNGGAKPDFVASILSTAARPCLSLKPEATFIFRFPDCVGIGGGTSSSSPHAAGVAALLISAARQSGLPSDARYITWALKMGARFLPNYPAHDQGAGLLDVVHSYELLQLAKETGLDIPDIETRAPNHTRLAKYLRDPGFGDGLYEREGWTTGDVGTRTIRLARHTGPATPVTYTIGWRGNDGTFSTAAKTVTVPLDASVDVAIRLAPKTAGMHSAHLLLLDQKANVPVHHVLATVVAAERFTTANRYSVRMSGKEPWPRSKSFFIDIPEGTASLRLDLAVTGGRVKLTTSDATFDHLISGREFGRPYRYASKGLRDFVYPGQTRTHVIADPEPGVMEVLIEPFGSSSQGPDSTQYDVTSEFQITASIQRASAVAAAPAAVSGTEVPVRFTSLQGPIGDARIAADVGMRRVLHGTAGGSEVPTSYYVTVDSLTSSLRVDVTADDPRDELALYLYDCAGAKCSLWDYATRNGARQSLAVVKPRAGAWKVVIDQARSPSATSAFTYTEILTSPGFGSVGPAAGSAEAEASGRYTGHVRWTPSGALRIGYSWVGVADLYDEARERAEREHPLGTFAAHLAPQRPVRLGTVVVPLSAESRAEANRR